MADGGQLLDLELTRGVESVQVVEETIDFGELAGPAHAAERSAFAELLSGSSDKSSRAYLSQRRNVERWVKGRRPVTLSVQRIVRARRMQSEKLRAFRDRGALMRVRVSWYDSRKPEWLPAGRWLVIPREVMREVLRDWHAGRHAGAWGELWRAFLERYAVPNVDDWVRNVELVELSLEQR